MGSRQRHFEPGYTYHVLNRGVKRQQLFSRSADCEAFEELVEETLERTPLVIFTYELMPNHWHFVVHPTSKKDLSECFQYLSGTHAKRFHAVRNSRVEIRRVT